MKQFAKQLGKFEIPNPVIWHSSCDADCIESSQNDFVGFASAAVLQIYSDATYRRIEISHLGNAALSIASSSSFPFLHERLFSRERVSIFRIPVAVSAT